MSLRRVLDSIVTRLLLLALGIVVTGTVARYYAVSQFLREDLSKVVQNQQMALASYVARDVDFKIQQRQALLRRLAAELPLDLLQRPAELQAWLRLHCDFQCPFSQGLYVVTPDGRAVADYPQMPGRAGRNFSDRDYIRIALSSPPNLDRIAIGRPVVGRVSKKPVLPMAAALPWRHGQPQGALAGVTALAAPGFLDLLLASRIGGPNSGFLLISPQDQMFIASSQPDMVLKPTPPTGINPLHDRAMAGFRGVGITVNAQGDEEVSAIASVPSTGWFVVARLPSSEAFATVDRVQTFLLKNAALAILVFALAAGAGLYLLFRPLFRAASHADRMTRGELPLEPLPVKRNDEVGHLLAAFNRLLSKLNQHQAELARMAHHDALTGLPNRALLADRLNMALARAQRKKGKLGLLFLDLDGFKQINDNYGHKAGDKVLWQAAQRLSGIVRQTDTLARIGGDEFVLLIGDLGEDAEEVARIVATKCIEMMQTPFDIGGEQRQLGISVGIALGNGESSADSLLQAADQAMYRAKKSGLSGCESVTL
ncbi:GGDEF domain-containing protein [Chromobacterium haemolyticum]|uniref:diguanylate cyclase domain-containing protein n=1 Tax=Chromobacterium haemolyticum TaxID=394935 RepID=UPI0009DA84F1|nr:diguanylate cyclase [Chromobacterium haemolyticum]OQS35548.1 GGDEF domain-containing protein [Chromobacterium haemolyticum]